ncbi:RHS repeat-associated core domain-containing protein [Frateuria sp. MAH-13]|uniref:RHS repeat-associated core domain-containing protein n=1 Tax=Frateuria flava TaxID=2821489 RepID=A0ABS4DQJ9_9GAMM|nr:RHS repeat-associated core domain-containing protein [Frateuria flava]
MKASGWRGAAWARVAAVVLVLLTLSLSDQAPAAETTTYVLTDVQGTVLAREGAQGNIIARYDYRPYGKQQTGPVAAGPGYTGHVEDPDTGLVYMQQRYYDPEVGRFLSVDPVMAYEKPMTNFNRYAYARNNPYRFTDPDGRDSVGKMIDSQAIGCGEVSCAGWAATKALWTVFGAEGVSQVYDKGAGASTGDKVMAGVEVASLGLGGKVGAGIRAVEGAAKWLAPAARMSRQVAREFGVAGKATRNGSGTIFKLADGKVTVRVMEEGGGRTNYLRVSVEGKGSVDAAGKLSSDMNATHIPIGKDSLRLIRDVVKRFAE